MMGRFKTMNLYYYSSFFFLFFINIAVAEVMINRSYNKKKSRPPKLPEPIDWHNGFIKHVGVATGEIPRCFTRTVLKNGRICIKSGLCRDYTFYKIEKKCYSTTFGPRDYADEVIMQELQRRDEEENEDA